MTSEKYILAMETGISGGSLAIFENETVLASWSGQNIVSRSEDVLENLSNLMNNNFMRPITFKGLIISKGPGSLTGLRIGRALALGFKTAYNCSLEATSLFKALSNQIEFSTQFEKLIVALKTNKNQITWQRFELREKGFERKFIETSDIKTCGSEDFFTNVQNRNCNIVTHFSSSVKEHDVDTDINFIEIKKDLAIILGLYSINNGQNKN